MTRAKAMVTATLPLPARTSNGNTNGSTKTPRMELTIVTPTLAEEWLGHNSHNRIIRNRWVEELVGVIQRGEWRVNGDSIRFDINGTLLDGQHRLWAVVDSGIAITSWVGFDLLPDVQDTMDQSIRRNLSDVLRLRNEPHSSALAAALNTKWRWEEGFVRMTSRKPSISQALAVLDRYPGLRDTVGPAYLLARKFKMSTAVLVVCWYDFATLDSGDAEAFFSQLSTGLSLDSGSPILAMRRWLERQMSGGTGARVSSVMFHALLVKAWNYYREGRQVEQLLWRAGGQHAEPFPVPQ